MTTIQPAITPTAPPPSPAAPAGPVIVVPQPSPELARLDAGTALEVLVLAKERQVAEDAAAKAARQDTAARQNDPKASTPPADPRATNVVVRTPVGDVNVRVPPQIEAQVDKGARLALEILKSSGGQVTARVVAIDGRPTAQVLTQPQPGPVAPAPLLPPLKPLPAPPTLPLGAAWFAGRPVQIAQLQPLAAFVINSASTPTALPGTSNPLPPLAVGSELGIRVTQIVAPNTAIASAQPGSPLGPTAVSGQAASAVIASPTPLLTATQSIQTTPGLQSQSPLLGPQVPQAPAPQAQSPQLSASAGNLTAPVPQTSTTSAVTQPVQVEPRSGLILPRRGESPPIAPQPPTLVQAAPAIATVTGTVIPSATPEVPLVRTPLGDLQLAIRANLPAGAQVMFEITSALPPRADGVIQLPTPPPGATLALSPTVGWANLTEALQILSRTDPQTAAQLTQAIPDGGPRTAASLMAFANALRTGDPRAWPGDSTLRGLERAGPRGAQLAAEISGEVRELSARANEAGGEWRTLPMPWNADGKIDRIALITRRENADDDDSKKNKGGRGSGTRFLINLDLSRLGEMQFDGMFRKVAKSFDLMIRTKESLPDEMARDLPVIFANANSAMGLTGSLSFQVVKKFPDPTQEKATFDRSGVWA